MWPFKRKQSNQSTVPTEVQDYYQAERRERVGVAWLLALATLITTIVLAFGLFFGGRWVYRKVTKHNKPTTTINSNPDSTPDTNTQNSPQPTPPNNPTPSGNASTGNTTTPTTSTSSPSQNTSGKPLANTGPGDTVAIFLGVTAVATLGHHLFTKRKLQNKA